MSGSPTEGERAWNALALVAGIDDPSDAAARLDVTADGESLLTGAVRLGGRRSRPWT